MHKIGQSGGLLCRLLGSLLKTVLNSLGKCVLIPLGLTAVVSATDAAVHKKIFGLGMTTLIISNEEMNDIIKIVKSLEESDLLIKGVSKTINNDANKKKSDISVCY